MPAPLLAHAQTSRMALTNQDSVQAAPPFKSNCLGAQRSLSKLSLVPALSSLPPIFLNQRAPNKDVTREGILVFGGVHSCWTGWPPAEKRDSNFIFTCGLSDTGSHIAQAGLKLTT